MPLASPPRLARALWTVTVLLALLPSARAQAAGESERTPACPAFEEAYGEYHLGFGGAVFHRSELEVQPALSPTMRDGLAALAAALRARGVRLVILPVPLRGSAMPAHVADPAFDAAEAARGYRALVARIEATGAEAIDLLAALEAPSPSASPRFYLRDPHWTGRGVRAAAEHVAATLRQRVALPEPRAFEVTEGRTAPLDAGPTQALAEACGIELAAQRATELEARERTDDADALFASDPPEVVLVGTSFTRDKYGFPARLTEALGLPVPSYAIGGGRVFASIDPYLTSDPFHEAPPRVLLWEMRANLFGEEVDPATFARIEASVAPLCGPDEARAVGRTNLDAARDVVRPFAAWPEPGNGGRLLLEFEDRSVRSFALVDTGTGETVRQVQRSPRGGNHGRFVLPLPPNLAPVDVGLTVPSDAGGMLAARVCEGPT